MPKDEIREWEAQNSPYSSGEDLENTVKNEATLLRRYQREVAKHPPHLLQKFSNYKKHLEEKKQDEAEQKTKDLQKHEIFGRLNQMHRFEKEFEIAFQEVDEVLDSTSKDSVFLPQVKTFVDKEREQNLGVVKSKKTGDSLDSAVMRNYLENRRKAAAEAGYEYTGDGYQDTEENEKEEELRSEVASVANEFWEDFERRSRHDVRVKKGRPAS